MTALDDRRFSAWARVDPPDVEPDDEVAIRAAGAIAVAAAHRRARAAGARPVRVVSVRVEQSTDPSVDALVVIADVEATRT